MEQINIDKLDDIQLVLYLAQKNNQGQPSLYIEKQADSMLEWIRDKRNPSEKKQEPAVKPSTEIELLIKELRADIYEEIENLDNKKVDKRKEKERMLGHLSGL